MGSLSFWLGDFNAGLLSKRYSPPQEFCPYYDVDVVSFHKEYVKRCVDVDRYGSAVNAVRKRVGEEYFRKACTHQAQTLEYASRAFPAYQFILPEVMRSDWLATVDWGKTCRDHVLHQPLCGYIVLSLLDECNAATFSLRRNESFLNSCVKTILEWKGTAFIRDFLIACGMKPNDPILNGDNPIAHYVWGNFFREAAYIAAIFHDLGYPWQYVERMQGNLDGLSVTTHGRSRNAEQIYEQFKHRLLYHALQGYQQPNASCPADWKRKIVELTDFAMAKTHGFPGAIGFLSLHDSVRRYPCPHESPLHLLCVEWAATAIMMHDMSKIYWGKHNDDYEKAPVNPSLRVSFDRDPLSALITLADVLEEFERPTVAFSGRSDQSAEFSYKSACKRTELYFVDKTGVLSIRYHMADAASRAMLRKGIGKEHHKYFDPQYGYLDLSGLGVNKVEMVVC